MTLRKAKALQKRNHEINQKLDYYCSKDIVTYSKTIHKLVKEQRN